MIINKINELSEYVLNIDATSFDDFFLDSPFNNLDLEMYSYIYKAYYKLKALQERYFEKYFEDVDIVELNYLDYKSDEDIFYAFCSMSSNSKDSHGKCIPYFERIIFGHKSDYFKRIRLECNENTVINQRLDFDLAEGMDWSEFDMSPDLNQFVWDLFELPDFKDYLDTIPLTWLVNPHKDGKMSLREQSALDTGLRILNEKLDLPRDFALYLFEKIQRFFFMPHYFAADNNMFFNIVLYIEQNDFAVPFILWLKSTDRHFDAYDRKIIFSVLKALWMYMDMDTRADEEPFDFMNCTPIMDKKTGMTACFFCLGEVYNQDPILPNQISRYLPLCKYMLECGILWLDNKYNFIENSRWDGIGSRFINKKEIEDIYEEYKEF